LVDDGRSGLVGIGGIFVFAKISGNILWRVEDKESELLFHLKRD
jgi:hypothetical protein